VLGDHVVDLAMPAEGELQPDAEREVFAALGLPYKPKAGSTLTEANVKRTADIFDEQKTAFSIRPQAEPANDPTHFVEVFDVNGRGDIYVVYDKVMYKYDAEGRQKETRPLPAGFKSPFCIVAVLCPRDRRVYSPPKKSPRPFEERTIRELVFPPAGRQEHGRLSGDGPPAADPCPAGAALSPSHHSCLC